MNIEMNYENLLNDMHVHENLPVCSYDILKK